MLGPDQMSGSAQISTPEGPRARVLAVDDHAAFLILLREVVCATRGLEAVGEAKSGEEAVEVARRLRPDVVLMDVRMPGLGGVAAARLIKEGCPSALVVLISTARRDELALDGTEMFVDAFVRKSDLAPKLLDRLWSQHAGLV
jgi:DNA-binding NarL/FixJ family response regulator